MIETITPLPENNNAFVPNNITFLQEEDARRYDKQFSGFVYSGGLAPITGNFTHTISPFEAFVHGYFVSQAATLMTYTANRRTYAFIDSVDSRASEISFSGGTGSTFKQRLGNLVFAECAVASLQPIPSVPGLIPLLFTDTSGASITDVTDLRTLSPLTTSTKIIDPASYGLVGDNLTDNSDEFQEMLDALPRGSIIRFGQGIYRFNTKVFVRNGCTIEGVGSSMLGTVFRFGHASSDMIEVLSTDQVIFGNLYFDASVTRTGGSALVFTGAAQLNRIESVTFDGHFNQVSIFAGRGWTIRDCYFANTRSCDINIQNAVGAHDNDAVIESNVFASSNPATRAILVGQSLGLAITNNRFISHTYGVQVDPAAFSGGLIISNNTFRDQTDIAVWFNRTVGTALFQLFQICNNIIQSPVATKAISIGNGVSNVFADGIIADNEILLTLSSAIAVFMNGDTQCLIEGNNFNLPNGGADTSICIQLTAFSTSANIGLNGYKAKTFVSNLSAISPLALPITLATGNITIDPPSISGNTQIEVTVALAVARVGDVLTLNRPSFTDLPATVGYLGCRVPSNGNISVFLYNETGGAINPSPATWAGTLIRGLL